MPEAWRDRAAGEWLRRMEKAGWRNRKGELIEDMPGHFAMYAEWRWQSWVMASQAPWEPGT